MNIVNNRYSNNCTALNRPNSSKTCNDKFCGTFNIMNHINSSQVCSPIYQSNLRLNIVNSGILNNNNSGGNIIPTADPKVSGYNDNLIINNRDTKIVNRDININPSINKLKLNIMSSSNSGMSLSTTNTSTTDVVTDTTSVLNKITKLTLNNDDICLGKTCTSIRHIGGGKHVCDHNNLIKLFPELCQQWDYKRNNRQPTDYLPTSHQRAFWICNDKHSYSAEIRKRTKGTGYCPDCPKQIPQKNPDICDGRSCGTGVKHPGNKYICDHNNLAVLYPEIAKEFHPEDNNGLNSENFLPGSHIDIKWRCGNNSSHIWIARISHRCLSKSGCPYCKNGRPCEDRNFTTEYPHLLEEWDYEKNERAPETYAPTSNDLLWWICKGRECGCRHSFRVSISNKTLHGSGCKDCTYGSPCPHYNIITQHKEISDEWNYQLNKQSPYEYNIHDDRLVWWKCSSPNNCGCHIWQASVGQKVRGLSVCPFCDGKKPCVHYNLKICFPDVCKDWNYELNTNDPTDYVPGSISRVWWKCHIHPNNIWDSKITYRTKGSNRCLICHPLNNKYSRSQIHWMDYIIKTQNIHIQHAENGGEYKIEGIGYVDGFCKDTNTIFELEGCFWHGCPICGYDPNGINPKNYKLFGELYNNTLNRNNKIISLGYNLVVIWEHEYKQLKAQLKLENF